MYHTSFPPQAMVHVVGNYGANGQFLPLQNLQNHPFYINNSNNVNQFHQVSRNISNFNRNRMVQVKLKNNSKYNNFKIGK